MPNSLFRRPLLSAFSLAALLLGSSSRLRADLSWSPQTGWYGEGGGLSGMTPKQTKTALGLMNKARNNEEKSDRGAAARGYEKVAKKFATSVYAPEALYRAGEMRMARKQYFKAFEDYSKMLGSYPNSKRFNEVVGKEYHIASLLLDGARNRIWGFIPGPTNRTRGVQYSEVVVATAPYSDYAPLALMSAARGEQYLGSTEEAIDSLDRMVNSYQQSVLAPSAYLKLGQLHASISEGPFYDQASTKEAISYFEDFTILYPSDPGIAEASQGIDTMKTMLALSKIKIGDFYFYKRDNYTAARVFYNEAITAYPDSTPAKLAKKRLAEVEAKASGHFLKPGPVHKKHFWLF